MTAATPPQSELVDIAVLCVTDEPECPEHLEALFYNAFPTGNARLVRQATLYVWSSSEANYTPDSPYSPVGMDIKLVTDNRSGVEIRGVRSVKTRLDSLPDL